MVLVPQYFGYLMWRTDSLEKTQMLGKTLTKVKRRRWQMMKYLYGITKSTDMFEQTLGDSEWQGSLAWYSSWGHKESGTTYPLNNNNLINTFVLFCFIEQQAFLFYKPTSIYFSHSRSWNSKIKVPADLLSGEVLFSENKYTFLTGTYYFVSKEKLWFFFSEQN